MRIVLALLVAAAMVSVSLAQCPSTQKKTDKKAQSCGCEKKAADCSCGDKCECAKKAK